MYLRISFYTVQYPGSPVKINYTSATITTFTINGAPVTPTPDPDDSMSIRIQVNFTSITDYAEFHIVASYTYPGQDPVTYNNKFIIYGYDLGITKLPEHFGNPEFKIMFPYPDLDSLYPYTIAYRRPVCGTIHVYSATVPTPGYYAEIDYLDENNNILAIGVNSQYNSPTPDRIFQRIRLFRGNPIPGNCGCGDSSLPAAELVKESIQESPTIVNILDRHFPSATVSTSCTECSSGCNIVDESTTIYVDVDYSNLAIYSVDDVKRHFITKQTIFLRLFAPSSETVVYSTTHNYNVPDPPTILSKEKFRFLFTPNTIGDHLIDVKISDYQSNKLIRLCSYQEILKSCNKLIIKQNNCSNFSFFNYYSEEQTLTISTLQDDNKFGNPIEYIVAPYSKLDITFEDNIYLLEFEDITNQGSVLVTKPLIVSCSLQNCILAYIQNLLCHEPKTCDKIGNYCNLIMVAMTFLLKANKYKELSKYFSYNSDLVSELVEINKLRKRLQDYCADFNLTLNKNNKQKCGCNG